MSNIATDKLLTKSNLAIQLLIGAFDKKTSKFKFGDKETAFECSLEPRDFAIMFKIRRVTESEELKKLLKQKNGPEPAAWLKNKFRPEKDADISEKIMKAEIERKLKDAAKDESDPQHFVRLFAMWLCTIFFFTYAGATGLAKKWLPHILNMDKVSWPDHIVEYLLKYIGKQKGSVTGCTTLLP
ncbi:hypothetical protein MKW98_031500, partial [Papaver atlanticum]